MRVFARPAPTDLRKGYNGLFALVRDELKRDPLSGDLFLYDLESRDTRQLTATESGETDPKFSSTGRYVSFIRDQDLYAIDVESLEESRLTHDGGGLVRNGMAEFIAQ